MKESSGENPSRAKRLVRKGVKFVAWFSVGLLAAAAITYSYIPLRFQLTVPEAPESRRGIVVSRDEVFAKDKRILVVVGHPDDPEFYIGGTLLNLKDAGAKLQLLCLTSGDKAYYPFGAPEGLTETREKEQTDATHAWGGEVEFARFMDGRLAASPDVVSRIKQEIDEFQPDIVMSFDPYFFKRRYHRDHVETGLATMEAIRQVEKSPLIMLFHSSAGKTTFDISSRWDEKTKLLAIHKSQFAESRLDFIIGLVGRAAQEEGKKIGVEYAESFRVLREPEAKE